MLGVPVEWEEQPFEWVRPARFGVVRRYSKGPIAELRVLAKLEERVVENKDANGGSVGTSLTYEVWAKPKNMLGPQLCQDTSRVRRAGSARID